MPFIPENFGQCEKEMSTPAPHLIVLVCPFKIRRSRFSTSDAPCTSPHRIVSCLWGTARFLHSKTLPCWVVQPSSLIHFSFCLDIDECDLGNHTCDTLEHGYCFNVKKLLPKDPGYRCVCESGYLKVGSACVKRGKGVTMFLFCPFSEKCVSWKNIKEMTKMYAAFPARLSFAFRPAVWMFLALTSYLPRIHFTEHHSWWFSLRWVVATSWSVILHKSMRYFIGVNCQWTTKALIFRNNACLSRLVPK